MYPETCYTPYIIIDSVIIINSTTKHKYGSSNIKTTQAITEIHPSLPTPQMLLTDKYMERVIPSALTTIKDTLQKDINTKENRQEIRFNVAYVVR